MRSNRMFAAALSALVVIPSVVSAQDGGGERRRIERAPEDSGSQWKRMELVMNRRARLGVKVSLRPSASDSIGATIEAVTPGGPAAQAGLRSGDIITKLDGQSVLKEEADSRARSGTSVPGLRLVELAARLEPNDTVGIEYRRGNERRTARLVTGDEPNVVMFRNFPGMPRGFAFGTGPETEFFRHEFGPEDFEMRFGNGGRGMSFMFGSPLGDLELAPLNEELGRYFGTSEGVLVINAPKSSSLNLRGGDVILAIDGRKPSGPAHLLRVLRSYEPNETFKLDIMRNRKRETVTGKLDESARGGEQARPRIRQRRDANES